MRKIVNLALIASALFASALAVSACNTVAGVGRDVKAVGDAMTSGAERAKS